MLRRARGRAWRLLRAAADAVVPAHGRAPLQVKVVKCMLRGVVVDISADQLGGVATLGFLEEARGGPRRSARQRAPP